MSWNVPATAVAGSILAAAFWNAQVRDNLALLKTSVSDDGTTWQGKLRALLTEQTITATGTQHDVSIAVGVTYLRVSNASALTITGFSIAGATPASTACIILDAVGAEPVTIAHQNAGSTAAYRVIAPDAADLVVPVGGRTMLLYDGTTERWRAVFGGGGGGGNEFPSGLKADAVDELNVGAGVTIDGVQLKDGGGTFAGHVLPDATANARNLGLTGQRFDAAFLATGIYEYGRTVAQNTWTDVPYASGNFSGSGTITWTVQVGDMLAHLYALSGTYLRLQVVLANTTVSGTGTGLRIALPAGLTVARTTSGPMFVRDNGVSQAGRWVATQGDAFVAVLNETGSNWAASTNNTQVIGTMDIPI